MSSFAESPPVTPAFARTETLPPWRHIEPRQPRRPKSAAKTEKRGSKRSAMQQRLKAMQDQKDAIKAAGGYDVILHDMLLKNIQDRKVWDQIVTNLKGRGITMRAIVVQLLVYTMFNEEIERRDIGNEYIKYKARGHDALMHLIDWGRTKVLDKYFFQYQPEDYFLIEDYLKEKTEWYTSMFPLVPGWERFLMEEDIGRQDTHVVQTASGGTWSESG